MTINEGDSRIVVLGILIASSLKKQLLDLWTFPSIHPLSHWWISEMMSDALQIVSYAQSVVVSANESHHHYCFLDTIASRKSDVASPFPETSLSTSICLKISLWI